MLECNIRYNCPEHQNIVKVIEVFKTLIKFPSTMLELYNVSVQAKRSTASNMTIYQTNITLTYPVQNNLFKRTGRFKYKNRSFNIHCYEKALRYFNTLRVC